MLKFVVCLSIALSGLAQSNSPGLDLLLQKGFEELSLGDTKRAEADFTAALSESQSEQDQIREVSADYYMYVLSEARHKPDAAEKWLLDGLESCRKPGSHVTTISRLPYLHSFYDRHRLWSQDVKALKSIVEFFSADQSTNVVSLAVYSRLLGEALLKTRDYPSAEVAFRPALSFSGQFEIIHRGQESAMDSGLMAALEKQGKKDQATDLKASPLSVVKPGVEPPSANIVETGEIKDVTIIVPVGFGMDSKCVEAVRLWKFKPALQDGKPTSAKVTITIQIG